MVFERLCSACNWSSWPTSVSASSSVAVSRTWGAKGFNETFAIFKFPDFFLSTKFAMLGNNLLKKLAKFAR
jgi:hypothetical protein